MAARRKATRKPAKRARAKGAAKPRAPRKRAGTQASRAGKRGAPGAAKKPPAPRKRAPVARPAAPPAQRAEPEARAAPRPAPHVALRVVGSAPALVARVIHYYGRAGAASLSLEGTLALGDWIHVRGATSDFVQRVASLRAGGRAAERAERGEISVQLAERARPGDCVFVLRPGP